MHAEVRTITDWHDRVLGRVKQQANPFVDVIPQSIEVCELFSNNVCTWNGHLKHLSKVERDHPEDRGFGGIP